MISNKTAAILFLITVNMKLVASTTPDDTQGPSSTGKLVFKKRPKLASDKTENVLRDTNNAENVVGVQVRSTKGTDTSKGPASSTENTAPPMSWGDVCRNPVQSFINWNNKREAGKFARLIKGRKYEEIARLSEKMSKEEFMEKLCPVIKIVGQYDKLFKHLERPDLEASFYVRGNMFVVRGAIISNSTDRECRQYVEEGVLEAALPLSLEEGRHGRFIELLKVRKWIMAKKDEKYPQTDEQARFGQFVFSFLCKLAPWNGGIAFKRFLTTHGDELRDKHPDIFDTLYESLVRVLGSKLGDPKAKKFLIDLIGQPSLLTPAQFVRGFLGDAFIFLDFPFIDHATSEAMEMGLKGGHPGRNKYLWQVMKTKRPSQFFGDLPVTKEAFAAVLKHFPTKQKLEDDWYEKCGKGAHKLSSKLKGLGPTFIPKDLWSIIASYANSWPDMDDEAISAE